MQITIPLILIAIGGAALITQRDGRVTLVALLLQWLGIAWETTSLGVGGFGAAVEAVTALSCVAIMALTLLGRQKAEGSNERNTEYGIRNITQSEIRNPKSAIIDQLWLWAVALTAGVAGFGLVRLNPMGLDEAGLMAFYWMALAAVITLVLDGARDGIKVGVGIMALLNAGVLLVYILSVSVPGVGLLALVALVRIATAVILSYLWLMLRTNYGDFNLAALYDGRDGMVGIRDQGSGIRGRELVVIGQGLEGSEGEDGESLLGQEEGGGDSLR